MKTIAFTGLNGVLGTFFIESDSKLFKKYSIIDLYNTVPTKSLLCKSIKLNLLQLKTIIPTLKKANPDIVIHLAAVTHIDQCEKDRENGKNGIVWQVNVEATKKIVEYCKKNKKKLLFMSTECVFEGVKARHSETDQPNPKNWYGITKAEAEAYILNNLSDAAIIRGVVAYHPNDNGKGTIFGKLLSRFKAGVAFTAVGDQFFTPTAIPDIVRTIELVIERQLAGIFHVAASQKTTPYVFARQLAELRGFDSSLVQETTLLDFLGEKKAVLRLQHACLNTRLTRQKLKISFKNLYQSLKVKSL